MTCLPSAASVGMASGSGRASGSTTAGHVPHAPVEARSSSRRAPGTAGSRGCGNCGTGLLGGALRAAVSVVIGRTRASRLATVLVCTAADLTQKVPLAAVVKGGGKLSILHHMSLKKWLVSTGVAHTFQMKAWTDHNVVLWWLDEVFLPYKTALTDDWVLLLSTQQATRMARLRGHAAMQPCVRDAPSTAPCSGSGSSTSLVSGNRFMRGLPRRSRTRLSGQTAARSAGSW